MLTLEGFIYSRDNFEGFQKVFSMHECVIVEIDILYGRLPVLRNTILAHKHKNTSFKSFSLNAFFLFIGVTYNTNIVQCIRLCTRNLSLFLLFCTSAESIGDELDLFEQIGDIC